MNEKGNTRQNRPGEWEIPGEEYIEPLDRIFPGSMLFMDQAQHPRRPLEIPLIIIHGAGSQVHSSSALALQLLLHAAFFDPLLRQFSTLK